MGYVAELRSLVGPRPLILAGAAILIVDTNGGLLLVQRADNDAWTVPGGYLEPGESLEDCARREAVEETRLKVGEVELFGIFSGRGQFYRNVNSALATFRCKILFDKFARGGPLSWSARFRLGTRSIERVQTDRVG